jgi:hypothetical protein
VNNEAQSLYAVLLLNRIRVAKLSGPDKSCDHSCMTDIFMQIEADFAQQ